MMIAMAKAVSAAATAIIKTAKKTPCNTSGNKYLLITTKFTTEEFRINSTEINMEIKLVRVINPYTPIKNSMDVKVRISYMLTPSIMFLMFEVRSLKSEDQKPKTVIYSQYNFFKFHLLFNFQFHSSDFSLPTSVFFVPFAITIAPIIAASNNTLITSNGKINPPAS